MDRPIFQRHPVVSNLFIIGLTMTVMVTEITSAPMDRNRKWSRKWAQGLVQDDEPYRPGRVQLLLQDDHVVLDNGVLQVTLSSPQGSITRITYNGIQNLLEDLNKESDRGYWDIVWTAPGIKRKKGLLDRLECTNFQVIMETEDMVELSFTRTWNSTQLGKRPPLNIDKRFVMLRGSSGIYTYMIYDRPEGWPHFILANTRFALKLNKQWFHYMAVSDTRQREMPLPDDRLPNRSQPLAYPEAVLLTNPTNPQFKGEVDDKYQYSGDSKDIRVHGWISSNPPTGLWHIVPSNEFRSGGPTKQYLTSHVGPTSLSVLLSTHYAGAELMANFSEGEPWNKVLGPLFIYANSMPEGDDCHFLWEDAKRQLMNEAQTWPYDFPTWPDYLSAAQRGSIHGRLIVYDRYENTSVVAGGAYIGLAKPGEAGSWQRESKGYQFWVKANQGGFFNIKNIRPGSYNLYAFVTGFIGDYKYEQPITILQGSDIDLGKIVYEPPREGPILWEIGVPDRSGEEFFIPDPDPGLINNIYLKPSSDRYRQYGLWDRYTDLYPEDDLIYTVNTSDYTKDWYFAQVCRKSSNGTYVGTTWEIQFELDQVAEEGMYYLRIALASAAHIDLQVRVNTNINPSDDGDDQQQTIISPALLTTTEIGQDNTIARHGIHGLYWLFNVAIPSSLLAKGNNTIYLAQPLGDSPWRGIIYDYIRLERPPFFIQNHN